MTRAASPAGASTAVAPAQSDRRASGWRLLAVCICTVCFFCLRVLPRQPLRLWSTTRPKLPEPPRPKALDDKIKCEVGSLNFNGWTLEEALHNDNKAYCPSSLAWPAADLPEVPTPGYAILVYDLNAQAPVCENKEVQLHMVKTSGKCLWRGPCLEGKENHQLEWAEVPETAAGNWLNARPFVYPKCISRPSDTLLRDGGRIGAMVVKPNPPGNCGKPMVSCLPLDIQKVALVHDYLVKLGLGEYELVIRDTFHVVTMDDLYQVQFMTGEEIKAALGMSKLGDAFKLLTAAKDIPKPVQPD